MKYAAWAYARYENRLKSSNALDFDDLLLKTLDLFNDNPDVLEKYRRRFAYIMVDEYQDTNTVQYNIVKRLAKGHGNIFVVGDDDQSIYGWRGADIRNILNFERDFPGARVIRLEQNYRSHQGILNAANGVIRHNAGRMGKELWSDTATGLKPLEFEARSDLRRGAVHRRKGGQPHRGGQLPRGGDRGLVPRQQPVACDRKQDEGAWRALRDLRRPELLRAQGDQGHPRVLKPCMQPQRRPVLYPRRRRAAQGRWRRGAAKALRLRAGAQPVAAYGLRRGGGYPAQTDRGGAEGFRGRDRRTRRPARTSER